ncbi:hypothetical protein SLEP1_g7732 [Rubroshorea leprosula]|uniref:Uncharacterized protein n=1 Tax=Rubroshorea leprosula TaxID=152421 RepID=A0AAV5I9A6_9ROSI|nr:hypothetical protein SLEP1_g7732 [Rubroshorea leprosula]
MEGMKMAMILTIYITILATFASFRVTVGLEDVGAIAPSRMESAGVAHGVPVIFAAVMACIVAWFF